MKIKPEKKKNLKKSPNYTIICARIKFYWISAAAKWLNSHSLLLPVCVRVFVFRLPRRVDEFTSQLTSYNARALIHIFVIRFISRHHSCACAVCIRGALHGHANTTTKHRTHRHGFPCQFHFISFFNSVLSLFGKWKYIVQSLWRSTLLLDKTAAATAAALVALHGLAIVFTYFHFIMTRLRLISIKKFQSIRAHSQNTFLFRIKLKLKILSFLLAAIFHLGLFWFFNSFFFSSSFIFLCGLNWVIAIKIYNLIRNNDHNKNPLRCCTFMF